MLTVDGGWKKVELVRAEYDVCSDAEGRLRIRLIGSRGEPLTTNSQFLINPRRPKVTNPNHRLRPMTSERSLR